MAIRKTRKNTKRKKRSVSKRRSDRIHIKIKNTLNSGVGQAKPAPSHTIIQQPNPGFTYVPPEFNYGLSRPERVLQTAGVPSRPERALERGSSRPVDPLAEMVSPPTAVLAKIPASARARAETLQEKIQRGEARGVVFKASDKKTHATVDAKIRLHDHEKKTQSFKKNPYI